MHLTALGIAAAKALVPATESEDEAGAGAAAEAGERQGVLTLTESRAFAGRVDERPLHSCWVVLRRGVLLYAPVTPTLPLTRTLTRTLTITLALPLTPGDGDAVAQRLQHDLQEWHEGHGGHVP